MTLSPKDIRRLPEDIFQSLFAGRPYGMAKEADQQLRKDLAAVGACEFQPGALVLRMGDLYAAERALNAASHSAGGALIGTDIPETIDPLPRAASVIRRAGAIVLEGLRGSLAVGKELTTSTISFRHELETISTTDGTFSSLSLSPHRLAGAAQLTRQLDKQAANLTARLLVQSLTAGIGAAVDAAALTGSGVMGQPSGLYSAAGVNTTTFSGAATVTLAADMEEKVCTADGVDENIVFIGHPKTRKKWRTIARLTSGLALWEGNQIFEKPAYVTTALAETAICCGDFSKCVVAFWGQGTPISLTVDPYTNSLSEKINVVVEAFADTGVLRANHFTINSGSATQ